MKATEPTENPQDHEQDPERVRLPDYSSETDHPPYPLPEVSDRVYLPNGPEFQF